MVKPFEKYSANINNPKWENLIKRETPLYSRNNDIRNEFERDYTRIIHSTAYRRLKHKTQVFYSPENDHICTRIEHVTHVESISYTIANYLGLNTELTKAISVAHDLGHSPFGHQGERILSKIAKRDLGDTFWHEKNGLNFVDNIELLEDNEKNKQNLNLTYAVRDGIISHCGEINENGLKPRDEYIDLNEYNRPNQYSPYTWEACVVKIADKISYIGRDIEDAITLGILDEHLTELYSLLNRKNDSKLNNTVIINDLISDLCKNSSYEKGLSFSDEGLKLINKIKEFNYNHIYSCERMKPSVKYFELVINEIYDTLLKTFDGTETLKNLDKLEKVYPKLAKSFKSWLSSYWNIGDRAHLKNKIIFDINSKTDFSRGILFYISGMTDSFALEIYNEIISF